MRSSARYWQGYKSHAFALAGRGIPLADTFAFADLMDWCCQTEPNQICPAKQAACCWLKEHGD
jgi:hypothetical protein